MPATATKPKTKEEKPTEIEELDEQIEVFEPVAKAVDRTFEHPQTGEEKTFVQYEMGFLTKIKFFRLLSGTLRLATEETGSNVNTLLYDVLGEEQAGEVNYIDAIMQLTELAPDFLEEAFVLILRVSPEDEIWFRESLDGISDEVGVDIIDTFIAQNAKAIKRFFTKDLRKVGQRFSQEISEGTELESEDTT